MEFVTLDNTSYAMDFQMESNPSTPYVSARSSPGRTSLSEIPSFCSAPGSPTHGLTAASFVWESGCGLIKGAKTDFDSDDFEFETSRRFENNLHQHQQLQHQEEDRRIGEQLPAMSFADELFSNGHVLPLKPPPRLQIGSTQGPRISTLRSPSSVLCGPFSGMSFKNKEFDPFMVALENVRKDETRGIQMTPDMRSQSFSQMRSPWGDDPTGGVQVQHENNGVGHLEPPRGQGLHVPRGLIMPMRSASERHTGPTRWGPESLVNSTITTFEGAADSGGPSAKVTRRWRSFPKGSKRRIVRDFLLLRSASERKADPKDDKLKNHPAALKNTKDSKNSDCSEKKSKQVPEDLRNKAPVPQNPSLFVCLRLSSKGMKEEN
ncbi:hypothetical protein MRB53_008130 [Persea americana]|uniref:Uncharacterized protein n=1 Tax=Persea americana TaxID=3435 RepID=A0ACC2MMK1_PERAE|nr:hypothetical protein MRB53_008130 [Persea americana]